MLWQEPLLFSAGDSLIFNRSLPKYLPSAGWSLLYEIAGNAPGAAPTFTSTPDPTNTFHQINVLPAVTALWLPGYFELSGFAVNVSGERHSIYYGEFVIQPNLGTGVNTANVQTHAQKMIPLLEKALESLAAHSIDDSNIQQTEIRRVKRMDLERQLAWNKELRRNEVALENVRNGRPSGQKIVPQMQIVQTGPVIGGVNYPFA
jgi:hypothetical protein